MRVDNYTNLQFGDKRDTIHITSLDLFTVGSVWIADMLHVPFGVSAAVFSLLPTYLKPPSVFSMARVLVYRAELACRWRNRHLRGHKQCHEQPNDSAYRTSSFPNGIRSADVVLTLLAAGLHPKRSRTDEHHGKLDRLQLPGQWQSRLYRR